MKVIGGFKHWQQQTLDRQIVKWLALGSVPESLCGVGILYLIVTPTDLLVDFC